MGAGLGAFAGPGGGGGAGPLLSPPYAADDRTAQSREPRAAAQAGRRRRLRALLRERRHRCRRARAQHARGARTAHGQRGEGRTLIAVVYRSAVWMLVNVVFSRVPRPVMTGMMATAIPVAISPYSMAVAARSSLRKASTRRIDAPSNAAVLRDPLSCGRPLRRPCEAAPRSPPPAETSPGKCTRPRWPRRARELAARSARPTTRRASPGSPQQRTKRYLVRTDSCKSSPDCRADRQPAQARPARKLADERNCALNGAGFPPRACRKG